jgi:GDP-4-dehydro-6-deoxy-D-mannose reductase
MSYAKLSLIMINQNAENNQETRVLITGVTGGIGKHLAVYLLSQGLEIYGLQRQLPADNSTSVLERPFIQIGDLLDSESLSYALDKVRPTYIYHLAGCIDRDINEGRLNYEVNVTGTIRLLNAIRSVGIAPKVLIASSSAVYGGSTYTPIKEDAELRPLTHYAVSKVSQEMVALKYQLTYGLHIIRVRTFNVIGPDLSPSLLCSALAQQIARAEQNGEGSIQIGNIKPHRDYTDVRDVVRAYHSLMQVGQSGEVYNVCSMRTYSVKECLDTLISQSRVPVSVEIDKSRYRDAEIEIQIGDSTKINRLSEWKPTIPFEQSLRDLLDSWRVKLKGENQ